MRTLSGIALLFGTAAYAQASSPAVQQSIQLRYLGQAGWEISDGKTVILVDPVISMVKLRRDTKPGDVLAQKELDQVLTPDTAAIDSTIHLPTTS